jgi:hypothetical protein
MRQSPFDLDVLERIVKCAPNLHGGGSLSPRVLRAIAKHLSDIQVEHSVETGSGASTLLFSHLSNDHTVFACDAGSGSVNNVKSSPLFKSSTTKFVEGPTQITLPAFRFQHTLQVALLDGPHAFPFPQLEYYYIYPHLDKGGLLILDDIHIRSVHDFFRFLGADAMFELLEVDGRTAFFRRTSAHVFDPLGDGWPGQGYNRRRLLRFVWWETIRNSVPATLRRAIKRIRNRKHTLLS